GDFTIEVVNQHRDHPFVQRAWLNENPIDRAWLKLSEFKPEATLRLEMGAQPSEFGRAEIPPSFIS
ncbi:MAG: hypothetical protein AAF357_03910, partial [Verrucomicrobiota bacterium]